jgi:hypothetical protein
MKKIIFRTSRGKAFIQYFPLKDRLFTSSGTELHLTAYFIIFPPSSRYLQSKLIKVCDSFTSSTSPESESQRIELPQLKNDISQHLEQTRRNIESIFETMRLTVENFNFYLR